MTAHYYVVAVHADSFSPNNGKIAGYLTEYGNFDTTRARARMIAGKQAAIDIAEEIAGRHSNSRFHFGVLGVTARASVKPERVRASNPKPPARKKK